MTAKRFAAFWAIDYVVAGVIVFTLVNGAVLLGLPTILRQAIAVFVPLSTLFFAWVAFHGSTKEPAHRYTVAALWLGLSIFLDVLTVALFYQASPLVLFTSPPTILAYGFKFFAVVGAGTLSRRSASASLPSPDLLPPAQA